MGWGGGGWGGGGGGGGGAEGGRGGGGGGGGVVGEGGEGGGGVEEKFILLFVECFCLFFFFVCFLYGFGENFLGVGGGGGGGGGGGWGGVGGWGVAGGGGGGVGGGGVGGRTCAMVPSMRPDRGKGHARFDATSTFASSPASQSQDSQVETPRAGARVHCPGARFEVQVAHSQAARWPHSDRAQFPTKPSNLLFSVRSGKASRAALLSS